MGQKLGKARNRDEQHKQTRFDYKANTPTENLLIAIHRGDCAAASDAICAGAACDWRGISEFGGTALHAAAMGGHTELCRMLVENCKLDIETQEGKFGKTALMEAAYNNHLETVQTLAELGANKDACDRETGRTALIWAADKGHQQMVEALLMMGADCNLADRAGKTALHWAASQGRQDIVGCLVSAGSNIDAVCSTSGRTALHYAGLNAHKNVFDQLGGAGFSLSLEDSRGRVPILLPKNEEGVMQVFVKTLADKKTQIFEIEAGDSIETVKSKVLANQVHSVNNFFDGEALGWDQIHDGIAGRNASEQFLPLHGVPSQQEHDACYGLKHSGLINESSSKSMYITDGADLNGDGRLSQQEYDAYYGTSHPSWEYNHVE